MATIGPKDYYAILGIPRDADSKTLKNAFRDLARRYHPDRNDAPDAQERFKQIAEAYAVLSDPDKRAEYDRSGTAGLRGVGVDDLLGGLDLADLFGQMPGFGGGEALFGHLFGPRAPRAPARGADLQLTVSVPLATILTGASQTLTIRRPGPCPTCSGTGAAPGTRPRNCDRCRGTGQQITGRRQGNVMLRQVTDCPTCRGNGTIIDEPCPTCGATGQAEHSKTLTVKIPAGLEEGATLRLPGKGMPAPAGGIAGDAYLTIHTEPDPRFTRRGAHLWHETQISVPDAVLGATLTVPALDGDLPLTVPPGTQPGTLLRAPGRGLPFPDGHGRGDLNVIVTPLIAEYPGEQEQRLYQQLREITEKADTRTPPTHA